jgi:predicted enzyme related to lactoylglutathione lyase
MHAKYVHTNLIAKDWKKLAKFYTDVFGCKLVPKDSILQKGVTYLLSVSFYQCYQVDIS